MRLHTHTDMRPLTMRRLTATGTRRPVPGTGKRLGVRQRLPGLKKDRGFSFFAGAQNRVAIAGVTFQGSRCGSRLSFTVTCDCRQISADILTISGLVHWPRTPGAACPLARCRAFQLELCLRLERRRKGDRQKILARKGDDPAARDRKSFSMPIRKHLTDRLPLFPRQLKLCPKPSRKPAPLCRFTQATRRIARSSRPVYRLGGRELIDPTALRDRVIAEARLTDRRRPKRSRKNQSDLP